MAVFSALSRNKNGNDSNGGAGVTQGGRCRLLLSLAEVEVDLVGVEEVADSARRGHDAVNALPLNRVDLAALVLST